MCGRPELIFWGQFLVEIATKRLVRAIGYGILYAAALRSGGNGVPKPCHGT